jgi:circadian clock protein KaiC
VKISSGIAGLDQITGGGIPKGRITLVAGGPGAGKTIAALQMLAGPARKSGEAGLFVSFEEDAEGLARTGRGFDWDFARLIDENKVKLFFPKLGPDAVLAGPFDLSGLLSILEAAARETGAERIIFDAVDMLLLFLNDEIAARRELNRIRDWVIGHGFTAILSTKVDAAGESPTESYGYLHYLADCVITLQHRLIEHVAIRGMRVLKCRGTAHSANEYPMLIESSGMTVYGPGPKQLSYPVFDERVSTGLERLDAMLDGGYYRGSSVLISGLPGSAKTTLGALLVHDATARGNTAVFVSFDEASDQIVRNLRSIGIDLKGAVDSGLLIMASYRAGSASAEEYFARIRDLLLNHKPSVLVVDPITALLKADGVAHGVGVAERLLDFAKSQAVTSLFTSLVSDTSVNADATLSQISTLSDTWMQLAFTAAGGERNRSLSIMKSRGTRHSGQVRELVLSEDGATLTDVFAAGGEVLMGTARAEREAARAAEELARQEDYEREVAELEASEQALVAKARELQVQIDVSRLRLQRIRSFEGGRVDRQNAVYDTIRRSRSADASDDSDSADTILQDA